MHNSENIQVYNLLVQNESPSKANDFDPSWKLKVLPDFGIATRKKYINKCENSIVVMMMSSTYCVFSPLWR